MNSAKSDLEILLNKLIKDDPFYKTILDDVMNFNESQIETLFLGEMPEGLQQLPERTRKQLTFLLCKIKYLRSIVNAYKGNKEDWKIIETFWNAKPCPNLKQLMKLAKSYNTDIKEKIFELLKNKYNINEEKMYGKKEEIIDLIIKDNYEDEETGLLSYFKGKIKDLNIDEIEELVDKEIQNINFNIPENELEKEKFLQQKAKTTKFIVEAFKYIKENQQQIIDFKYICSKVHDEYKNKISSSNEIEEREVCLKYEEDKIKFIVIDFGNKNKSEKFLSLLKEKPEILDIIPKVSDKKSIIYFTLTLFDYLYKVYSCILRNEVMNIERENLEEVNVNEIRDDFEKMKEEIPDTLEKIIEWINEEKIKKIDDVLKKFQFLILHIKMYINKINNAKNELLSQNDGIKKKILHLCSDVIFASLGMGLSKSKFSKMFYLAAGICDGIYYFYNTSNFKEINKYSNELEKKYERLNKTIKNMENYLNKL